MEYNIYFFAKSSDFLQIMFTLELYTIVNPEGDPIDCKFLFHKFFLYKTALYIQSGFCCLLIIL